MAWNDFIKENSGSFLQSREWGEFQKSIGRKVWRLKESNLRAQVIKHDLPFSKSYLYIPKGPVFKKTNSYSCEQDIRGLAKKISDIAGKENAFFCKLEPETDCSFDKLNYKIKNPAKNIQPQRTLFLDLTPSEESILYQMHKKTRYNIRLAQRKGVGFQTVRADKKNNLEEFWRLLQQTAERDNFKTHSKRYYQKMCRVLGEADIVEIFSAKYRDKTIAANLVVFFGDKATYLHGASDYNYRKLMAPFLLQWGAVLKAKERGMKWYDFWGIDEKKWSGVTRFKKRFGGKEVSYPPASDLVLSKFWYKIYKTSKALKY